MDLMRVANVKAVHDEMPPELKAEIKADSAKARGFLAKAFPALPESDRAAIAWFMSETLTQMRMVPVSDISKVTLDSAAGYAYATVELLGWAGE